MAVPLLQSRPERPRTRSTPHHAGATHSGHASPAAANRLELDVIGAVLGTDKSSNVKQSWDYLRHYDSFFHPFRHEAINVIEVGVAGGLSLALWQWYFSAARIVGIDIMPTARRYAADRAIVEIGSQADAAFMQDVCRAHPPTIFIDDGSHLAEHNVATFECVFPMLLPGGLYVVEDLALHLGPSASDWQTDKPRNAPEYFLDLSRSCLARHHVPGGESVPRSLLRMVDSVAFINSAAVIRKRGEPVGLDSAMEAASAYVEDVALGAGGYERLAFYPLRHGDPLPLAEAACRAAIEAGSRSLPVWALHDALMLRGGRGPQAVSAMLQGLAMAGEGAPQRRKLMGEIETSGLTADVFDQLCSVIVSELGWMVAQPMVNILRRLRP
jgi:hypothetical protein